jgi:ParB-like chromosome segregation protein Spo0J
MEIRKVPISLLNAAPYNPRKDLQPGDPEYQKIARSIEKYGCVEPIIWNEKTGNVIGGHQRLKVLAATGAVEVDLRHRQSVRIPRFPVVGRGRIPCNP